MGGIKPDVPVIGVVDDHQPPQVLRLQSILYELEDIRFVVSKSWNTELGSNLPKGSLNTFSTEGRDPEDSALGIFGEGAIRKLDGKRRLATPPESVHCHASMTIRDEEASFQLFKLRFASSEVLVPWEWQF
jgi:hypothetical protein